MCCFHRVSYHTTNSKFMNEAHKQNRTSNRIRRLQRRRVLIGDLLPGARASVEKGETRPQVVEDMLHQLHTIEGELRRRGVEL